MNLSNLALLNNEQSRSITAENPTGAKGGGAHETPDDKHPGRELGVGWKIKPCITLPPNSITTIAEIDGPGTVRHIWMTAKIAFWRRLIVRFYWDDETDPSIEVPYGDLFCNGWCELALIDSIPIAANPSGGFNSYWEMPFRRKCRITVENLWHEEHTGFFYQIDYGLGDVPESAAYLHAQWRRSNPVPYGQVHTVLDGVTGHGHYVGTYLAWQVNSNGWWGEGEVKFFLDGDDEFPTICGTGTEDYFGGAWNFDVAGEYVPFSTAYLGLPQILRPDGTYRANTRFGLYRWHICDPIRFHEDLKVTIQALGWRSNYRYLPLQDDVASTAFWYQNEPHAPFPPMGSANDLEVILK